MKKTLFFIAIIFLFGCKNQEDKLNDKLLTVSEVGADNMPFKIAEVKAPFKIIDFVRPTFKADTIFINEVNNFTHNVNKAIKELSAKGGGVVFISQGKWESGRIELKSNVNLHISKSAIIQFSGEIEDYLPAVPTRIEGIEVTSLGACIYANGQTNIAVTGKGKLIGPPKDSDVRNKILTHKLIDDVVDLSKNVEERIFDGSDFEWIFPPMFISPINCTKVFIEGISLENSAFWNVVPIFCNNVIIRGISVNSIGIKRGDGIDIDSSSDVLIEYCTLKTGDDCFTIKAGRGKDGVDKGIATENVVIRYSLALEGHGGITCGTETAGMIRNLYMHDSVFEGTDVGINFKSRRTRGGGGENIHYERIRMNLKMTAIKWDMLGNVKYLGELALRLPKHEVTELTPKYENIFINDILIENSTHFLKIVALPESPLKDVKINNVKANSTELISIQDATNIEITNCNIKSKNNIIEVLDCENITLKNVNINDDNEVEIKISGDNPNAIKIL